MPQPTYRQMALNIFRGQPNPHVLFQPRFEPWFAWHTQFDSLPAELKGMDVAQAYELVDCGQRYLHYYTGQPDPVTKQFRDEVKITVDKTPEKCTAVFHTPHGDLTQVSEFTVDRTWRVIGFLGRRTEDLDALEWLIRRLDVSFDLSQYKAGDDYLGDRGVGQFWIPKSPYLALALEYMSFEAFIYAMADAPEKMERIMAAIDEGYDRLYEQLCAANLPIINFGENVAQAHMSPTYFEKYMLPWYEKRVGQLRDAGTFTHIHIDGYFRNLIPQIRKLPHDGLEALTPQPQGDVTLDEVEEACEGKILLDGIPAVLFLKHHPMEQLQECVEDLCRRFGQRLILGISDELPQGADDEGFRRMRWVADYARKQALAPSPA